MTRNDIIDRLKLRRIINASGTMTALGASRVRPEAAAMSLEIIDHFVDIDELQAAAGRAIAQATGAEAGCVTSSASSAMSIAIAAAMTGPDLGRIERLPDTAGLKSEVVVQAGHLVNYGAPIEQAIRLAGASPVAVDAGRDITSSITSNTTAALYVVSHHVADPGMPLGEFIAVFKPHGIPVIVDCASEYDLRGPVALGADIAIYSAHKFLGGLTAGVMAGRRDIIRAAYLQNRGIGRHMKVGKEGIAGAIAALEAWSKRDHAAARARQLGIAALWLASLRDVPGLSVEKCADSTGNPIDRVKVSVHKDAGLYAWELAARLAARDPSVRVRDDLLEHGYFFLDPCNLAPGEEETVARAIRSEVELAAKRRDGCRESFANHCKRITARQLEWPEGF